MAQVPPFDPETAATLRAAYDEAAVRLLNQPDIVRETVAKRVAAHWPRKANVMPMRFATKL